MRCRSTSQARAVSDRPRSSARSKQSRESPQAAPRRGGEALRELRTGRPRSARARCGSRLGRRGARSPPSTARRWPFERAFTDPAGLPERPWYRHLIHAPDAPTRRWSFPGLPKPSPPATRRVVEEAARVAQRSAAAARCVARWSGPQSVVTAGQRCRPSTWLAGGHASDACRYRTTDYGRDSACSLAALRRSNSPHDCTTSPGGLHVCDRGVSTVLALAQPAVPQADDKTIVHVLNRIGFGPTPAAIERVRRIGRPRLRR